MVTSEDGFGDTGGCNVALPNGLSFNSTDLTTQSNNPNRIVMLMNTTMPALVYDYTAPLAFVQSIMALPNGSSTYSTLKAFVITKDTPLVAHECAIIPCIQRQHLALGRPIDKMKSSGLPATDDIVPVIEITEQWDNYTVSESGDVSIYFENPDQNKNISEQQKNMYTTPFITGTTYTGMRDYFKDFLTGYVYSSTNTDLFATSSTVRYIQDHTLNETWTSFYCGGNQTMQDGVPCGMRKIAAGLTNAFRLSSWQIEENGSRPLLNGTTKEPKQICAAQWQYVSAPVAVWILGLALFVGVVVKTRRANIKAWRTSPLATLLLRLDPDSREHLKDWQNMGDAELKAMAQDLRLRLQIDENGPRFVR